MMGLARVTCLVTINSPVAINSPLPIVNTEMFTIARLFD